MLNQFILLFLIFLSIQVFYVQLQNVSDPKSTILKSTKTRRALENELDKFDLYLWCKLQPNTYSCGKGHVYSRFYYDVTLGDCKSYYYGQCHPSYNNYNSITSCHESCTVPGAKPLRGNFSDVIVCRLQPEFGDCHEYHPMFYYDRNLKRCRGFSYSGCGGNNNRFPTAQICASVCLNLTESDVN